MMTFTVHGWGAGLLQADLVEEFLVQIKPLPSGLSVESIRLAEHGTDGDVSLQDLMWREGLSHDDVDRLLANCNGTVIRHRRHAGMVD